jgi:hypothetical protein
MYKLYRGIRAGINFLDKRYKSSNDAIQGYEPESWEGESPVIQYRQKEHRAIVVGIQTEEPGDITYDRKTGIVRSYTKGLFESNVGHARKITQDDLTDRFIGDLNRFIISPIYDAPTLHTNRVKLRMRQKNTTLRDCLDQRGN